jgi:hypothetical protein
MFMLCGDGVNTIVFATYEKVVQVLTDLRWDGSYQSARKILQAMPSITTGDEEVVDASERACMACGGEWFTLSYFDGAYATDCITGDPMTGGHELRELFRETPPAEILALLRTMMEPCDGDGIPL